MRSAALTRSLTRSRESKLLMSQNDLVLSHSGAEGEDETEEKRAEGKEKTEEEEEEERSLGRRRKSAMSLHFAVEEDGKKKK